MVGKIAFCDRQTDRHDRTHNDAAFLNGWLLSDSTQVMCVVDVADMYRPCTQAEFLCDECKCMSTALRCNGNRDCRDGTDELNCSTVYPFLLIRLYISVNIGQLAGEKEGEIGGNKFWRGSTPMIGWLVTTCHMA